MKAQDAFWCCINARSEPPYFQLRSPEIKAFKNTRKINDRLTVTIVVYSNVYIRETTKTTMHRALQAFDVIMHMVRSANKMTEIYLIDDLVSSSYVKHNASNQLLLSLYNGETSRNKWALDNNWNKKLIISLFGVH